jgi:hypothetical protein
MKYVCGVKERISSLHGRLLGFPAPANDCSSELGESGCELLFPVGEETEFSLGGLGSKKDGLRICIDVEVVDISFFV